MAGYSPFRWFSSVFVVVIAVCELDDLAFVGDVLVCGRQIVAGIKRWELQVCRDSDGLALLDNHPPGAPQDHVRDS
jgi:hypothetical protein